MREPEFYALVLAMGADVHAIEVRLRQLEVRRVHVSREVEDWSRYRRTLQNQVTRGAYAVVQLENGSRICWTTTSKRAQVATLGRWSGRPVQLITAQSVTEMEDLLLEDLEDVFTRVRQDRRSRAVTARGFDPAEAVEAREQLVRFRRVAMGREDLDPEEAEAFVFWWEEMLGRELRRVSRGTPVSPEVYAVIPPELRELYRVTRGGR